MAGASGVAHRHRRLRGGGLSRRRRPERAPEPFRETPARRRLALLVLGTSVGCDQVTKRIATATLMGQGVKSYAGDLVRLEYARNRGAFLSLGANLPESVR